MSSGLLLMAVMGLLFPAVLHATRTELHFGKSELALSRFTSCVMLVAYAAFLVFQLKSQSNLYLPVNEVSTKSISLLFSFGLTTLEILTFYQWNFTCLFLLLKVMHSASVFICVMCNLTSIIDKPGRSNRREFGWRRGSWDLQVGISSLAVNFDCMDIGPLAISCRCYRGRKTAPFHVLRFLFI